MIAMRMRFPMIIVVAAAMFSTGGCALIGPLVGQFQTPKKVDALFDLPANKRILVLAEHRTSGAGYETVSATLTAALNRQLLAHKLAAAVVPYRDLMALRLSTFQYHRLATTEIAKLLKADLVIYVHVDKCQLKSYPGAVLWQGRMEASVKVIQASGKGEAKLWPDRPTGHPVAPVVRDPVVDSSPTYGSRMTKALAIEMADRVAKLFYKHELTGADAYLGSPTSDDEPMLQ